MLGDLPEDFLRMPDTPQQYPAVVHPQGYTFNPVSQTKLTVTVIQVCQHPHSQQPWSLV